MPLITLTSDFGADSPYVAQMKGSIYQTLPTATVVDVCHSVRPQDIAAGARMLANVSPHFPIGTVHVAVVDPGVGTDRRILVAEVDGQTYIGPDNGILTIVIQRGSQKRLFVAENRELWRAETSSTFHGRDIMTPLAAHLLAGQPIETCGPEATDPHFIQLSEIRRTGRKLIGEIVSIDSFGNCITNIRQSDLDGADLDSIEVLCGPGKVRGISRTYGDAVEGKLVALFDSSGFLEIAINQRHAATQLWVCIEEPVVVVLPKERAIDATNS